MKRKGWKKGWKNINIKKINVKNNYRKIGKKKNNDIEADVAQLEQNNNKCYASIFRYIYIYI